MSFDLRARARTRAAAALAALVLIATGVGLSALPATAGDDNQPAGCSTPNRRMTLYAEELAPEGDEVRLGWGLSPSTASTPGPLIEMVEGDCLAITVVNDVAAATLEQLREDPEDPLGVSLHVHGVKYRPASDGTLHQGSFVPPGTSRTFVWYAQPRVVAAGRVTSNGTAGTWWYHDHVVGTAHGTGGMRAGLVGGLIVRRPTDPKPDRTYTVVMGPKDELNFRSSDEFCAGGHETAPAGDSCLKAEVGERVEFVVFNVGDAFHTFHLHGHNWADNRTGIPDAAVDTQLIDARGIGPSESFGFQVVAGESVGAGHWMLHCHVQSHSDNGMATDFHVHGAEPAATDPAGALPVHSH
jgi:FtsP/CotA-like multicopper oxidase with cupredoxin domain